VDLAADIEDPNPEEKRGKIDPPEGRNNQKLIARFYKICASSNFNRRRIEAFLIKKGFGDTGDRLSEADWAGIRSVRDVSDLLWSKGEKY
jgi:hypothetical protein